MQSPTVGGLIGRLRLINCYMLIIMRVANIAFQIIFAEVSIGFYAEF